MKLLIFQHSRFSHPASEWELSSEILDYLQVFQEDDQLKKYIIGIK